MAGASRRVVGLTRTGLLIIDVFTHDRTPPRGDHPRRSGPCHCGQSAATAVVADRTDRKNQA
jgi:hypothetical protein